MIRKRKKNRIIYSERVQRLDKLKEIRNRSFSDSFYTSEQWLQARYKAIVQCSGKCLSCGAPSTEVRLHVDHIKPRSLYPELQFDQDNLQVLCEPCNLGKGSWDMTDWRKR